MLKKMQHSGKRTTDIQNDDFDELAAVVDTLKVVSCPVCQASFIPVTRHAMATTEPLPLLETAFLRVCHTCFRCQRPACPQCWNPIHNVCAACSEEAQLPFRLPLPSLAGLVFALPASPQLQVDGTPNVSFTCLANGRFYTSDQTPIRTESFSETGSVTHALHPGQFTIPHASPIVEEHSSASSIYPTWLQEVMGHKTQSPVTDEVSQQERALVYQPQSEKLVDDPACQSMVWVQETHTSLQSPQTSDLKTSSPVSKGKEKVSWLEHLEDALILVTSALLLIIVLMIVFAINSASMNELFFHLFHVDFRAEIAYLFQLVVH